MPLRVESRHLCFLIWVFFFIMGLNMSSSFYVPKQKKLLFLHIQNRMVVTLLERSLLSGPQGQQAEVDGALKPGTCCYVTCPVVSRARCLSFHGSRQHRPGEVMAGREGVSVRSRQTSCCHTDSRQPGLCSLDHTRGTERCPWWWCSLGLGTFPEDRGG